MTRDHRHHLTRRRPPWRRHFDPLATQLAWWRYERRSRRYLLQTFGRARVS